MAYPQLYRRGILGLEWTRKKFFGFMLDGLYQSGIAFFIPYLVFIWSPTHSVNGHDFSVWEFGTTVAACACTAANLFVGLHIRYWSWIVFVVIIGSILSFHVWIAIYSQFETYFFDNQLTCEFICSSSVRSRFETDILPLFFELPRRSVRNAQLLVKYAPRTNRRHRTQVHLEVPSHDLFSPRWRHREGNGDSRDERERTSARSRRFLLHRLAPSRNSRSSPVGCTSDGRFHSIKANLRRHVLRTLLPSKLFKRLPFLGSDSFSFWTCPLWFTLLFSSTRYRTSPRLSNTTFCPSIYPHRRHHRLDSFRITSLSLFRATHWRRSIRCPRVSTSIYGWRHARLYRILRSPISESPRRLEKRSSTSSSPSTNSSPTRFSLYRRIRNVNLLFTLRLLSCPFLLLRYLLYLSRQFVLNLGLFGRIPFSFLLLLLVFTNRNLCKETLPYSSTTDRASRGLSKCTRERRTRNMVNSNNMLMITQDMIKSMRGTQRSSRRGN